MLYESNQPRRYKLGLIKTLLIGIERIYSNDALKNEEIERLKTVLTKSGYPKHIIRKDIKEGHLSIKRLSNKNKIMKLKRIHILR